MKIDFMQNEASFWVSLDNFIAHVDVNESAQGREQKRRLQKVITEKLKQLNQAYDKSQKSIP